MAIGDTIAVVMGPEKGVPSGVATLDNDGILSAAQRPNSVEDVIHCNTNDDIEAAIKSCYSTMADGTIRNILLVIDEPGLTLPGGNNFLAVYRGNRNFGMILAYTYSNHFIASRAYRNAAWQQWRYAMFTDEAYGLGATIGTNCSDFDTLRINGFYAINGAQNAPVFGGSTYGYGHALVTAANTRVRVDYYAHQYTTRPHFVRYWFQEKGWEPWECVNPPLVSGVEYRTVERYLSKPVYVKFVDCGLLPNNATKKILFGVDNLETLLHYDAHMSGGFILPYHDATTGNKVEIVNIDTQSILLSTNYDATNLASDVVIYYTKSTD